LGDGNKWKDGKSKNPIYKGWVVVTGLKRGKYEQWNIPWEWGLYTSENLQRRGILFHVLECGLRMSGGFLVKLVWLMYLGQGLWSFCDCWTLSFGLSSFLLRKDWLTTPPEDLSLPYCKFSALMKFDWRTALQHGRPEHESHSHHPLLL
jgi:hypothetical protein